MLTFFVEGTGSLIILLFLGALLALAFLFA